jgi:hypothetical protein
MDEDCERIRLRKDVRDDVVGSERKSRRRKKGDGGWALAPESSQSLGGENKGKDCPN